MSEGSSNPLPTDVEQDTPFQAQQYINNRVTTAMAHHNSRGKDIAPTINPFLRFKEEKKRLETFDTWPQVANVKKEDLARDGFIYLKIGDRCQCVFCRGVLSDWEEGDVVKDEHRRYCPECPFAFGYACGNIPLQAGATHSTVLTVPVQQSNNYQHTIHIVPHSEGTTNMYGANVTVTTPSVQESNRSDAIGEHGRLPSLPPQQTTQGTENTMATNAPKYPAWENEQLRLRSFKGWPPQMNQTPRDLAQAGLVYLGAGDKCKCYWCGGELYEWEPEDDPWEEHAKWFSYCNHVRRIKGSEYITYVKNKQNGVITEYPSDVFSKPHVLAVLQNGYTRDQVQEVMNRFGSLELTDANRIVQAIEETKRERQAFLNRNNVSNGRDEVSVAPEDNDITMEEADPVSVRKPQQATPEPESETNLKTVVVSPSSSNWRSSVTGIKKPSLSEAKSGDVHSSASATSKGKPCAAEQGTKDVNSVLLENESLKDRTLCKICLDNPLSITFLPCGHLSTCEECSQGMTDCPICRKPIKEKVKIYWS